MKTLVILNPSAGGGTAGRERSRILASLRGAIGEMELAETAHRLHATELARDGWSAGFRRFIAVGGDGTLSEVVNGLPLEDAPGEAAVGMIVCGTGGDFRRTFGIPAGAEAGIERLRSGVVRNIDVGRVTFVDDEGHPARRLFVNIASFGLSGLADRKVNRARGSKRLGGRAVFMAATISAFLGYRFQNIGLVIDGTPLDAEIVTVAVANGRYFGGGMMFAPEADPCDGLFDVIISTGRNKAAMLGGMNRLYRGEHVRDPSVRCFRAREVMAHPLDPAEGPVLLDVDGEDPGRLPARFDLLPGALRLLA
jgi:diacylglycerol kinase (ATP)